MKAKTLKSRLAALLGGFMLLGAAWWLSVGSWFALSEPKGFKGGIENVLSGSQDLLLRYNELSMILLGENPYRLANEGTHQARAAEMLGPGRLLDPDYFPSTLLPVLCLMWLPFSTAKGVWLALNLASVVLLALTVRWMMEPRLPSTGRQLVLISIWAASIPVWSCLAMGQATLFSLALTLAAFRADFQGRWLLAGLLLAFGVFKYAVVWPFVLFFFILQWRWRCLVTAGSIHVVVHLLLCRLMQADPVTIFAEVLGGNAKVFHRESLITIWTPFRAWNRHFPDLAVPVQVCGAVLLLLILGGLACLWLRRDRDSREGLVAWTAVLALLAVLVVTSRTFSHMYVLPALLLAGMPAPVPFVFTPFQRGCLVYFCLHLAAVPSGADDLGLPPDDVRRLMLLYNVFLTMLAFSLARLLLRMERGRASTTR
jgi:hypothetical protein